MERVYPQKLSLFKVLMMIIIGIVFSIWLKQFLYKNIMMPKTLTQDFTTEDITKIVVDNIPKTTPDLRIVEITKEVIKEVYIMVTPTPEGKILKGKYSWYYPPLGGINCDRDSDGKEECEFMANGDRWQDWYERGAACPSEFNFGTRIKIVELNLILTCVDRGGEIIKDQDGYYWIDHLTNAPRLYWSTPITLQILN